MNRTALLAALLALAACAHDTAQPPGRTASPAATPAPTLAPGQRITIAGPTTGQPGVPNAVLVACREEAERATVAQNRGGLMRLDEAENRGADSLFQNQTERGLLVVRRDRLFRECLARNAGAPQAATPR
jgi:hypothetical protein